MGWLSDAPQPKPECKKLPSPLGRRAGARWQCDDCNKIYVLTLTTQYNEPIWAWRNEATLHANR